MTTKNQTILMWIAGIIPMALAFAVLHEDTRVSVRDRFNPDYRKLVSVAFGNVLGDGTPAQILKVKTRDALFIEVYNAATRELVERIEIPEKKDGHLMFRGEATNLVITDIDGDDVSEILAPAYDQNLNARLNVFRYQPETKSFEQVKGPRAEFISDL